MLELPNLLEKQNFYLVGIKGVAMTAMASCLQDAGKNVAGSDISEDFVTKPSLDKLGLTKIATFEQALPDDIEVVIFSGANGGSHNPQVVAAQAAGLIVLSHARALAALFNQKDGLAVCGVGGKSTISAMIAFATNQFAPQSYAVGVGEIIGLQKTGQYLPESQFFIAEADEYVEDPATLSSTKQTIIPRFAYLQPKIIICSSLRYDHPDVYRDFAHTQETYLQFFQSLPNSGTLIYNADDVNLSALIKKITNPHLKLLSYGQTEDADFRLLSYRQENGQAQLIITYGDYVFDLITKLPGIFNAYNFTAALAAAVPMGLRLDWYSPGVADYHSGARRFQLIGERQGVICYDDYAHHPDEVAAAIQAINEFHPGKRIVIAFQSHTYSRTKQLFSEFVQAFATAPELVMIDIFPSAREAFDPTVSSDTLCQAIQKAYPTHQVQNLHTISALQTYLNSLPADTVFLTLGAGDIYHVYD